MLGQQSQRGDRCAFKSGQCGGFELSEKTQLRFDLVRDCYLLGLELKGANHSTCWIDGRAGYSCRGLAFVRCDGNGQCPLLGRRCLCAEYGSRRVARRQGGGGREELHLCSDGQRDCHLLGLHGCWSSYHSIKLARSGASCLRWHAQLCHNLDFFSDLLGLQQLGANRLPHVDRGDDYLFWHAPQLCCTFWSGYLLGKDYP